MVPVMAATPMTRQAVPQQQRALHRQEPERSRRENCDKVVLVHWAILRIQEVAGVDVLTRLPSSNKKASRSAVLAATTPGAAAPGAVPAVSVDHVWTEDTLRKCNRHATRVFQP